MHLMQILLKRLIKKQFLYYKTLGEKAIDQLQPEQLFVSINEDTNSIALVRNWSRSSVAFRCSFTVVTSHSIEAAIAL